MYKLVLILAMMTVWLSAHLIQVEQEMAMKTLFQAKRAVNRAAHAAAQQLDKEALGAGVLRIDREAAADAAALYLQTNLQLEADYTPSPRSALREPVEVLVFDIINSDESFPYYYNNAAYEFEAVLRQPGVVLIAKVINPGAFTVIDRIEWQVKGVAELVAG